jgi:hypothetical protein
LTIRGSSGRGELSRSWCGASRSREKRSCKEGKGNRVTVG